MKHKQNYILAAFVTLALAVQAKPVDPATACRVAQRYLPQATLVASQPWDELYLVTPTDGKGFVLVSADDCVLPVLAWSTTSIFRLDSIPDHVQSWIDGYRREIASHVAAGTSPSDEVVAQWQESPAPKDAPEVVGPLMSTTWNQSPLYNNQCPSGSGGRAVTGCVATAQAQVMKYWNHPAQGHGSHSYFSSYGGTLSADFETTYQWNQMPNSLGWHSTSDEVNAVAKLMFHAGVSVEMNYGANSSGAHVMSHGSETYPSTENALKKYFRYSPLLHSISKSSYTDREWDSVMIVEVRHGRPVLFVGYDASSGHAFILDGYSADHAVTTGNRFFHFNWGWGGWNDGFYTLDSLSPGSGGTGGNATYTFNLDNSALIGVSPIYNSQGDNVAVVNVLPADSALGSVSGSGTYRTYTDTVSIMVTAADGYRFAGWSSGSTVNPVFFVSPGDFSDTAFFEPVSGDNLYYCLSGMNKYVRNGTDTTSWGIRLPVSVRQPQRSLTAVQVYVYGSGRYFVEIFQGDSAKRATRLYSKRHYLGGGGRWHNIELDSAIIVDDVRPLWVCLRNNADDFIYPATMSHYCGNPDGSWFRRDGHWHNIADDGEYGTWMIHAILEPRERQHFAVEVGTKYFLDTVEMTLPSGCTVAGDGIFYEGAQTTITASSDSGMHFWYWVSNYGDTICDNPYTFNVDYPVVYTAVYAPYGVGIGTVSPEAMHVAVNGRIVSTDLDVHAYDVQGRLVATGRHFTLPAAGVYVLRAEGVVKKIVVR